MNRIIFQQLSTERIEDAQALLFAKRWSGAYYLAGYALECALKSCVVAFVEQNAGIIFVTKNFQSKCWTHDLESLVVQAGLVPERDLLASSNSKFEQNWIIAKDWSEESRYEAKSQLQAEKLLNAIDDSKDGVLKWVRTLW